MPGRPSLDTEVFIQQGAVQSLDKAILCGLRTLVVRCSMPSSFRNKFVEVMVRSPAELTPIVRQDCIDPCLMSLENRQYRFIEHMD